MIYTRLTDTKTGKSYLIDSTPKYVIYKLRQHTGDLIFLSQEGVNNLNRLQYKKDNSDILRVAFRSYFELEEASDFIEQQPKEEVELEEASEMTDFLIEPEEVRLRISKNLKQKNGKVSK
jgi:hypothetical protein